MKNDLEIKLNVVITEGCAPCISYNEWMNYIAQYLFYKNQKGW